MGYKPISGRFKDYIAIPRANGYQSLHTTLFGPNGMPIEVQIRTEDMHKVAESGIAAHWQYKAGDAGDRAHSDRAREWLQQLVEIQQGGSSEEFLESVKVDLFPDKVYVFTPKGEIRRLPRGATCVDFAYAVLPTRQTLVAAKARPAAGAPEHAASQWPDGRSDPPPRVHYEPSWAPSSSPQVASRIPSLPQDLIAASHGARTAGSLNRALEEFSLSLRSSPGGASIRK